MRSIVYPSFLNSHLFKKKMVNPWRWGGGLFDDGGSGTDFEIDPAYMWQDTFGTIPVFNPTEPVALILDKSQGVRVAQEQQAPLD